MGRLRRFIAIFAALFIALILLLWGGLQIRPAPFARFSHASTANQDTIPLPADLPPPVERFYRIILQEHTPATTAGESTPETPVIEVPVITSAVISGRAQLRINGITMPARFRFIHQAGQAYRHYIETTLFGVPLLRVNEHFLAGQSRLELPFGVVEKEPKIDQAANLGLWAESIWYPTIFLTDPRVRWESIDAHTAALIVPFADNPTGEAERFLVRFDPETGLITWLESMRYKEATDTAKTLWLNQTLAWGTFDGTRLPTEAALIWMDEGTPWAVFQVEEIIYNVDVDTYIQQKGP